MDNPDIIKNVFAKIDDSIDVSRDAPDYATNFNIFVVPLSRKDEITPKIEAFKNYDWQNDEDFSDFVAWMKNRGVPADTVLFYINMARYPS
ncbi:hypothetical protein [uncultured Treponema sp.]|uniref:hypothetical protein n=1 Tax=uncultured Treponema sp. TaxID=162155 RepID=UPI0025DF2DB1|nr:hypothetical protein [uncultured Treponema sp.]